MRPRKVTIMQWDSTAGALVRTPAVLIDIIIMPAYKEYSGEYHFPEAQGVVEVVKTGAYETWPLNNLEARA